MPERSDISPRGIGAGAAIVIIGIAVSLAAAWMLSSRVAAPRSEPPAIEGPRLQTAPEQDIAAYRREKQARLEGYGRVDEHHVHIPIERAMQMLSKGRER